MDADEAVESVVPPKVVELRSLLGEGHFCENFLCMLSGELVVAKAYKKQNQNDVLESIVRGQRAAEALNGHPFISSYIARGGTNSHVYIFTEYVGNVDLEDLLLCNGLGEDSSRFYALEICAALAYIHSFHMIYNGLCPQNVAIAVDGHVKLVEFAHSYFMVPSSPPIERDIRGCRPAYMAPEIVLMQPSCPTVDWWSYGVLVHEMITGNSPFVQHDRDQNIIGLLQDIISNPIHIDLSGDAYDFVNDLLDRNPCGRLGFAGAGEVFGAPWMHGVDEHEILRKGLQPPHLPLGPAPTNVEVVRTLTPNGFLDRTPVYAATVFDNWPRLDLYYGKEASPSSTITSFNMRHESSSLWTTRIEIRGESSSTTVPFTRTSAPWGPPDSSGMLQVDQATERNVACYKQ